MVTFQIPDKKRWKNSDVKILSYDKKVDDVYYEIEVIKISFPVNTWINPF